MESGRYDVLLCVTGLTPQVVTETIFALYREAGHGRASRIPREVQIITTTEGRRRVEQSLLSHDGARGQLERLCTDYGLDPAAIRFDESCIHTVRDAEGRELADIVDEVGNRAVADLIHDRIRQLTRRDDIRLHVSLAGGRKTMGFYAGYVLSLYARPQDRLSHVLVNPPFESHPEFYYPPPQPQILLTDNNEPISTADARVTLADIPFVRLRDELDPSLLEGDLTFSEAVARAQKVLERPDLRIDLSERRAWLQGTPVRLSPTKFAWLTWLALRAHRGEPPVAFDEGAGNELARVIEWLEGSGPSALREALESALEELRETGQTNYFDRNRTRLNRALTDESGLPRVVVERYLVHALGQRPHTRYGLTLRPEAIRIEGEP